MDLATTIAEGLYIEAVVGVDLRYRRLKVGTEGVHRFSDVRYSRRLYVGWSTSAGPKGDSTARSSFSMSLSWRRIRS